MGQLWRMIFLEFKSSKERMMRVGMLTGGGKTALG